MKAIHSALIRLSACALVSLSIAQGEESRFYLRGDLGGSLIEETPANLRQGPNPLLGVPGQNSRFNARFEPGVRTGMACGYQIRDWFAAEGEIGAIVNDVNSNGLRDGTFSNIPFLFNVKLQYPNHSNWTPYVGAGAGISVAILDADVLVHGDVFNTYQRVPATEADAVFAYQAFAGLRYMLNERMGLSVEYHYLATDALQWDAQASQYVHTTLALARIETHIFSLAFDYRF